MRRLKRREEKPDINPYEARSLPIAKKVAIYYRQSTETQVGNVSTLFQTVDMVDHLKKLGWQQEDIMLIDLDRGISGTKGIRERPGMSILFDLIEHGEIGAVAAQDVDRFFRESAQIETNIFIDACRRNNVLVITPHVVYDFAHPIMGHFHIQMFREQAQRAADFLEFYVKGRLHKARNYADERGMYVGRRIAPGFMVDMRTSLADGSPNPNYRKYVKFKPWADVILMCFELFRIQHGNLNKTCQMIQANGICLPDVTPSMIPPGFHWKHNLISVPHGLRIPMDQGLAYILTNVAYIGHWIHKHEIACWNNHEVIIPLDLFMYAFNRISPTDFHGKPNPDHQSYHDWLRSEDSDRPEALPIYHHLIFSNDLVDESHKVVHTRWMSGGYSYKFSGPGLQEHSWSTRARTIDQLIDNLLLEHLRQLVLDDTKSRHANEFTSPFSSVRESQLQEKFQNLNQTISHLISSIATSTNPKMVKQFQLRFEQTDNQLRALTDELKTVGRMPDISLTSIRELVDKGISDWKALTRNEKRSLFENVATHILISKLTVTTKRITVFWRTGYTSTSELNSKDSKII